MILRTYPRQASLYNTDWISTLYLRAQSNTPWPQTHRAKNTTNKHSLEFTHAHRLARDDSNPRRGRRRVSQVHEPVVRDRVILSVRRRRPSGAQPRPRIMGHLASCARACNSPADGRLRVRYRPTSETTARKEEN
jgi:hypothetical protein